MKSLGIIVSFLAISLSSCSIWSKKGDSNQNNDHQDPPLTSPQPTPGPSDGPPPNGDPKETDVKLTFGLVLVDSQASADTLYYSDVKTIFLKSCAKSCHSVAHQKPDLSGYPFNTPADPRSMDEITALVIKRLNDSVKPMPQTGKLPAFEIERITKWVNQGYLEKPTPVAQDAVPNYKVDYRYAFNDGSLSEYKPTTYDASAGFVSNLTDVNLASALKLFLRITGPSGTVVLEKDMGAYSFHGSPNFFLNVYATAEGAAPTPTPTPTAPPPPPPSDQTPPTLPANAGISFSNLTDRSLVAKWNPATDNETRPNDLTYTLYSSDEAENLKTIADAEKKGDFIATLKGAVIQKVVGLIPQQNYYFTVVVKDAVGNATLYRTSLAKSSELVSESYDIVTFGKECSARLGSLKPFSCLDGQIIPITVDGKVPENGYPEFGPNGSHNMNCDRPALLGLGGGEGQCPPYARLGRLDSYMSDGHVNKDVDTVFICRRYRGRFGNYPYNGQQFKGEVYPGFEDVAIIQHSRKTGETCYFQMLSTSDPKDARRVPPPDEDRLPSNAPSYALSSRNFWLSPGGIAGINCISCHDSDPFIHTPHVDQVRLASGDPLVPTDPFGQYRVIGRQYFTEWLAEGVRPNAINTREPNQCTTCHRIGSRTTCNNWSLQSVGQRDNGSLSDYARREFKVNHWMPPFGLESFEEWENNAGGFKSSFHALQECCNNPNSRECSSSPVNRAPPAYAGAP